MTGSETQESSLGTINGHFAFPVLSSQSEASSSRNRSRDYAQLRQLIREKGLLERQPGYYTAVTLGTIAMAGLGLLGLAILRNSNFVFLDAVFLALIWGQLIFLGHDAAHRQIFRAGRRADLFCLILGDLVLGVSQAWWIDKHNRHHAHPNQEGLDPDIEIMVLAFSGEQARNRRGILRGVARHQAYLFFPMLTLEAIAMQVMGVSFVVRNRAKYRRAEALLLVAHHVLFLALLFTLLGFWRGLAVFAIQQGLFGINLGCSFAPNHKGMPMLEKDSQMDFLRRQILTARNVRPNLLVDYLYGGLNYQIEHHLFPTLPRNKLGQARKIVQAFCREKGIPYVESGVLASFREVLSHLHQMGALVR